MFCNFVFLCLVFLCFTIIPFTIDYPSTNRSGKINPDLIFSEKNFSSVYVDYQT